MQAANFGFLAVHDVKLVQIGAQAERYFRDDLATCLIKLRQFAEFLAKLTAAHHAVHFGERESFEEALRRLSYERISPERQPMCSTCCGSRGTLLFMRPAVSTLMPSRP